MTDEEKAPALALHDKHMAMEARFAVEAGWNVPLSYGSALEEVETAHRDAVVCDVSSLTRLRIAGNDALELLERLCTHDVARQEDDCAQLTCLCNDSGGIIDCGYLYRLENHWLLTGDPGNHDKLLAHLELHAEGLDVKIKDQTWRSCQFWVTGANAARRLDDLLGREVSTMPPGALRSESYLVAKVIASRTGYGPLWSLEVIVPGLLAGQAWQFVTARSREKALLPLGYAARDVLRIQAGLCRYGHEINEAIDPYTAGLGRCVRPEGGFLGAKALVQRAKDVSRRRCRIAMEASEAGGSASIPRMGAEVLDCQGNTIGTVTSGTYCPIRNVSLAMAYVANQTRDREQVEVVMQGSRQTGRVESVNR